MLESQPAAAHRRWCYLHGIPLIDPSDWCPSGQWFMSFFGIVRLVTMPEAVNKILTEGVAPDVVNREDWDLEVEIEKQEYVHESR